jgi:hypothetical protein
MVSISIANRKPDVKSNRSVDYLSESRYVNRSGLSKLAKSPLATGISTEESPQISRPTPASEDRLLARERVEPQHHFATTTSKNHYSGEKIASRFGLAL